MSNNYKYKFNGREKLNTNTFGGKSNNNKKISIISKKKKKSILTKESVCY